MSRERLSFYLKYALRSLRRDGQRSLFAAFCVAVGVGAVVAMQSLGLVVTDTMSENVKAIVGGDIVLTPRMAPYDEDALAAFARLKDEGKIEDYTVTIEADNDEIKKREADYSVRNSVSPMYIPRRWFVDPQTYPLYGQLKASRPKDVSLAQLLVEPYDVVVSDNVYDILALALGDEIVFFTSDVTHPFTVKGGRPGLCHRGRGCAVVRLRHPALRAGGGDARSPEALGHQQFPLLAFFRFSHEALVPPAVFGDKGRSKER